MNVATTTEMMGWPPQLTVPWRIPCDVCGTISEETWLDRRTGAEYHFCAKHWDLFRVAMRESAWHTKPDSVIRRLREELR